MTDSSKPDSTPNQSIENKIGGSVFTFNGRYSQRKFWRWALLLPVLVVLTVFPLVSMSDPRGGDGGAIVLLLIALPFFFLYTKLIAHRLHDIGKSAWWSLAFFLLPIVMFRESSAMQVRLERNSEWIQAYSTFMALGSLAIFVGGFIVMGCLRGTKGPNQYGPDPLAETKPEDQPSA